MRFYEESEKVGLKLNIQKTKIMASGPITSWEIDGEAMETVTDFIFGTSGPSPPGLLHGDPQRLRDLRLPGRSPGHRGAGH